VKNLDDECTKLAVINAKSLEKAKSGYIIILRYGFNLILMLLLNYQIQQGNFIW